LSADQKVRGLRSPENDSLRWNPSSQPDSFAYRLPRPYHPCLRTEQLFTVASGRVGNKPATPTSGNYMESGVQLRTRW